VLFNSYTFVFLFLPLTAIGYLLLAPLPSRQFGIAWLVGASLLYYGWWEPRYLALLLPSILINYALGIFIDRAPIGPLRRALLFTGILGNLLLLGYFKYFNFFVDTINAIADSELRTASIVLPLGISFFTFQQIAYLVDVHSGKAEEHSVLDYALFVCFFPQLIAGPIVHHGEILPQFSRRSGYRPDDYDFSVGVTMFTLGLFKKVVIADTMATFASPVFVTAESGAPIAFWLAWQGALAYTLQLYFDFSGYSDMAIGAARLFGIKLPLNFDSPYKARNIIDFWRRWHMTLSRFLRDYLYIPLGGNQKGKSRRYLNLIITMVLGGLWHGAGWTFVFWGLLHGLYLCINHAYRALVKDHGFARNDSPVVNSLHTGITFLSVVIAWIFFRAESFGGAITMLAGMTDVVGVTTASSSLEAWTRIAAACLLVLFAPNSQEILSQYDPALGATPARGWVAWKPNGRWALITAAMAVYGILNISKTSEFIYYQF
jgi:D-alanyl-lipoteichoic acid acyltransferase DltB (MBOAT superfamily)